MKNMKKLGKLSINPEKVMKNEDLIGLKGGYGESDTCGWDGGGFTQPYCGYSKETVLTWVQEYGV